MSLAVCEVVGPGASKTGGVVGGEHDPERPRGRRRKIHESGRMWRCWRRRDQERRGVRGGHEPGRPKKETGEYVSLAACEEVREGAGRTGGG